MSKLLDDVLEEINVYMDSIEFVHNKKLLVALHCEHKDLWGIAELKNARKAYLFGVAIHNEDHAKVKGWYTN